MEMAGRFLKWRVADLLVGFPDIEICFGTRVRSLPDALRIATPKKRLPGAGGGFLTRIKKGRPPAFSGFFCHSEGLCMYRTYKPSTVVVI